MSDFSAVLDEFWGVAEGFRLIVDPSLPHDRRVTILRRPSGTIASVSSKIAELVDSTGSEGDLRAALAAASVAVHEPDNLYYFPEPVKRGLEIAPTVRRLGGDDGAVFDRFQASASEQDRDDAFVELDHWAVFGSFEGDRLVAAASAYPWRDSELADIGVLTLPDFRGRGHGRTVVRGLGAHIIAQGFEPQYRCQLDNAGSIAVAASAGLALFGTWEVVEPDGGEQ